jgi:hypothetical protein
MIRAPFWSSPNIFLDVVGQRKSSASQQICTDKHLAIKAFFQKGQYLGGENWVQSVIYQVFETDKQKDYWRYNK